MLLTDMTVEGLISRVIVVIVRAVVEELFLFMQLVDIRGGLKYEWKLHVII